MTRLLPLLLCLILLTGCVGGTLLVPWPPMPTSVILSPTPRPTIDASTLRGSQRRRSLPPRLSSARKRSTRPRCVPTGCRLRKPPG